MYLLSIIEGYKLRKHIAKALQARSQAIKTALANYNAAAAALSPPRQQLTWDEVVEYAFLADFDLLRDTRQDIRTRDWAKPSGRALMDTYFKIERAKEEITRLNVEIRRLVTYIVDERDFLLQKEEELSHTDPYLAHQVRLYRSERGRFDEVHMKRLTAFARSKRWKFTGTLAPGIGKLSSYRYESPDVEALPPDVSGNVVESDSESEDEFEVEEGIDADAEAVLTVSSD